MRVIFGITFLGGLGLLITSAWPGLVVDMVFGIPQLCGSILVLGCWFLMLNYLALRELATRSESLSGQRFWGLWSALFMYGTIALLWYHVPERVTFAVYESDFRILLDGAPLSEYRGGVKLDRQFGPFHVDRYAADRRGGVYFRTATGPDGISPDQISYGFAFQPNAKGTPFGNAHYMRSHLFGDWWTFSVSDDW